MAPGREDYLGRNIKCVGWKYPVNKHWVLLLAYTPFPAIWIWISEICDSQWKSLNIYSTCVYYGNKPSWFINRDYGSLNIAPEKPEVKPSKMEKIHEHATAVESNYNIGSWYKRAKEIQLFNRGKTLSDKHFLWLEPGKRIETDNFFLHNFWVLNYELCFNR